MIKKNKIRIILAILALFIGGSIFIYRMHSSDMQAMGEFVQAYESYDRYNSDDTLATLVAKSDFKLSSLVKNDRQLMEQARTVSDLAVKELVGLKGLDKNYPNLVKDRKSAYAHFQELEN